MQKEYKIDPELQKVMPKLTSEEKEELRKSLLKDGFKGAPIIVWGDIIIDGHNRYQICKENEIPFEVKELEFESKDEVIQWMIRAQLGRRNLIPAQRADLIRKFRPIYEKQAKENLTKASGGDRRSEDFKKNQGSQKSSKVENVDQGLPTLVKVENPVDTTKKLAEMADMSKESYRKAEKVLDSSNEKLKQEMLSGEKTINASYKELQRLEKEGRAIEKPKSDGMNKEVTDSLSDRNSNSKLEAILNRCADTINVLQGDIDWLSAKEFFTSDGDDLTSKTQSEIKTCISKLRELSNVLSTMREDDCGDENVIILEK